MQYLYPAHVHIQMSPAAPMMPHREGGLVPEQVAMAVDTGSQVTRQQL